MIIRWYSNIAFLLVLLAGNAGAATVYVTSQLQFGLHADKSIGSAVIKLVPTGTPLELIKTEDSFSYVRTEDGTGGWIDNSYLTQEVPVAAGFTEISPSQPASAENTGDESSLEQQLKSERVRTGELQVQIAELRKRLGQDGSNDSLYAKIDQLAVEKKQLEVQLAQILEGNGPIGTVSRPVTDSGGGGLYNLRNVLIALSVALVAGMIAGLYLMDFLYRRRHGGFRI